MEAGLSKKQPETDREVVAASPVHTLDGDMPLHTYSTISLFPLLV